MEIKIFFCLVDILRNRAAAGWGKLPITSAWRNGGSSTRESVVGNLTFVAAY